MSSLKQRLEQLCLQWDGKNTQLLQGAFQQWSDSSGFVDSLIDLAQREECVIPATWLLKNWTEQKLSFTVDQQVCLVECLHHTLPWEAALHLLQLLPALTIPNSHAAFVADQLRLLHTHKNKFVRAWAINGFDELSRQHHEYNEEAEAVFAMAEQTEAASVRARVRKILKRRSGTG